MVDSRSSNSSLKTVNVAPKAFCAMALHAATYKNSSVHGILLGSSTKGVIVVEDAVPVSHGAPTKPLVEISLGLVQAKSDHTIVGWYTAPELFSDSRPGPVALRMTANLATGTIEPTLIVLQNGPLSKCLGGEGKADGVLQAFGKDFGQQYLESVETAVQDGPKASRAVQEAFKDSTKLEDLEDHLKGPQHASWYPSSALSNLSL
jgi:hypothetical protein